MEGQSCATTATSQDVSVDEISSAGDSTATQASDSGSECCSWTSTVGGDKNGDETDSNGASTSCTPCVQETKFRHDTIVYVLQDVQSSQVPVVADESGVINCSESGLVESRDTPTVVGGPQTSTSCLTGADHVLPAGSTGNQSSTFDMTECLSHVTEETPGNQSITVLSTDAHNHTTIVECNPSIIPQVDLTQTTSCPENSCRISPQRGTEAEKKGNLDLPLPDDEEVGGKCGSTSLDSLLPVTTNDKQMSQAGEEKEKNRKVAISGTKELEGQAQTQHKLLKAASACPSGLFTPISFEMLITDQKKQGQAKKGAKGDPFKKETNADIVAGTTELSENQNVRQQQLLRWDTKILQSHNEEHTLGHTSKGTHDEGRKSESIPDHTAGEGKDSVTELIFAEPGRKSEGLTVDKNMEEASSCNMHMEPLDLSTVVERTSTLLREQRMPEVTDNSREDILITDMANREENLMEEDLGSAKGSKSIEVISLTQDKKMIVEENTPEMGNLESPLDKSQACAKKADKELSCDHREEDLQSEQLLDHKWSHSFTCNICSFTVFSVKDIEDHCARCELAQVAPNSTEVVGNGSDKMECEEVRIECTSQLTDSSQCDDLKEKDHAEVLPNQVGPTDQPSPDAQSTLVMLSQEGSNAVKDESPGPLQQRVPASTDHAQGKRGVRGKNRSPRNICQGDDHIMAGWKAIVVHPTKGTVRTRTFWQCPDCPYKTDKIYPSIKEHGARHVVSAKFPCEVCTYSCPTETGIRSHRRMHKNNHNQKSGKKDKFEVQVLTRQLRRRLRKNRRVYRCGRCSFSTLVLASFEKHCKKHTRKASRRHTQRENVTMIGECTTTANDVKNEHEPKDGSVYKAHEANSLESQTYKAPTRGQRSHAFVKGCYRYIT